MCLFLYIIICNIEKHLRPPSNMHCCNLFFNISAHFFIIDVLAQFQHIPTPDSKGFLQLPVFLVYQGLRGPQLCVTHTLLCAALLVTYEHTYHCRLVRRYFCHS